MLDELNAESQEPLPEKSKSASMELSDTEITRAAKARIKTSEWAIILIGIVPGILLLFAFWPLGLVLLGLGGYFRYIAIDDHKRAILFEMGDYGQRARVARPMTTRRRLGFWLSAVWFGLGMLVLLFSIYPSMSVGMMAEKSVFCLIFFFGPAYFACRKLAPGYTLSMLFSAKRRAEFILHEQHEKALAIQQWKEWKEWSLAEAERQRIATEQKRIKADCSAKFKAEERERELVWKAEEQERESVRKAEKQAKTDEIKRLQEAFLLSVQRKCGHDPVVATVLGGSGMPLATGEVVWVSCRSDAIAFSRIARQEDFIIPYSVLVNAEVMGPGTERSNAGVIGGGFGLEGAAKGILIATVINVLTSTKKTNTFLNLLTKSGEVRLHVTTLEPEQLRLTLSPVFVRVEAQRHARVTPNSLASEIEKLILLRSMGELTEHEFSSAKKKLLSG